MRARQPEVKSICGAISTAAMTHTAIIEKLNGKAVDWMEHVSDADYQSACAICDQQGKP